MQTTGQGFLIRNLYYLVGWLMMAIIIMMSSMLLDAHANTMTNSKKHMSSNHNILIIASPASTIQTVLANIISDKLSHKYKNVEINIKAPKKLSSTYRITPDIIIAIGSSAIQSSREHYVSVNRLLIATDPAQYYNRITAQHTAVLYMTQPYCKQLRFIKQLNPDWHSISYLHDDSRNINRKNLEICAHRLKLGIYKGHVNNIKYLSENIKDALNHSDLLLALPDKRIYNSETVKNILLTCYRYRKPVIAFSRNFVRAGALAAIYSDINQITDSAISILSVSIKNKNSFPTGVFYPEKFNISINPQVFEALNLDVPDVQRIKRTLTIKRYSSEVTK